MTHSPRHCWSMPLVRPAWLGRLALCSAAAALLAYGWALYRSATEPGRRYLRDLRCLGQIRQLHRALTRYVKEHGALPYAPGQPEVADPYQLGELKDPFGGDEVVIFCCPAAAGRARSANITDSGYRMFNWTKEQWETLARRRVQPEEAPPLVWCATACHDAHRVIVVFQAISDPLEDPAEWLLTSLQSGMAHVIEEAEFQRRMRAVSWSREFGSEPR